MSAEDAVNFSNFDTGETLSDIKHILFVRHGDYDPKHETGVGGAGLNEVGLAEARSLHDKLHVSPAEVKGYSTNSLRSLGTVALAMFPYLQPSEVPLVVDDLANKDRLIITSALDYLPIPDEILEQKLTEVYNSGRNLAFLVYESDEYEAKTGLAFSTSNRMAAEIVKLLLDEALKSTRGVLVCGREFFYPCFRAVMTRETQSNQAMGDFIDWYQQHVELNNEARTWTARITNRLGSNNFFLEDEFGDLCFDMFCLESVRRKLAPQSDMFKDEL